MIEKIYISLCLLKSILKMNFIYHYQIQDEEALQNYQEYLNMDNVQLVPNPAAFTCPICFDDFEMGDGIMLQECLHMFCK